MECSLPAMTSPRRHQWDRRRRDAVKTPSPRWIESFSNLLHPPPPVGSLGVWVCVAPPSLFLLWGLAHVITPPRSLKHSAFFSPPWNCNPQKRTWRRKLTKKLSTHDRKRFPKRYTKHTCWTSTLEQKSKNVIRLPLSVQIEGWLPTKSTEKLTTRMSDA